MIIPKASNYDTNFEFNLQAESFCIIFKFSKMHPSFVIFFSFVKLWAFISFVLFFSLASISNQICFLCVVVDFFVPFLYALVFSPCLLE